MTPAPAPAKHPARFTVEQFHRLCEAVPEQRLALQLRVEAPLDLGPANEPEPDLALVARRADDYWHAHPTAADTALVIEVADTSLAFDLEAKARLYAGAAAACGAGAGERLRWILSGGSQGFGGAAATGSAPLPSHGSSAAAT